MATETEQLNLLQRKARQWAQKVVDLYNTPVPSQLEGQKSALLSFAKKIKTAVEKITGPLDSLAVMNQLGFVPVIIGAVAVTAAIAAITKWTLDYNKFKAKLAEMKTLRDGGMSARDAANIVNAAESPGFFGGANKLVLGAGGLVLLFMLAKNRKWV